METKNVDIRYIIQRTWMEDNCISENLRMLNHQLFLMKIISISENNIEISA